jgi:hypothetical protein
MGSAKDFGNKLPEAQPSLDSGRRTVRPVRQLGITATRGCAGAPPGLMLGARVVPGRRGRARRSARPMWGDQLIAAASIVSVRAPLETVDDKSPRGFRACGSDWRVDTTTCAIWKSNDSEVALSETRSVSSGWPRQKSRACSIRKGRTCPWLVCSAACCTGTVPTKNSPKSWSGSPPQVHYLVEALDRRGRRRGRDLGGDLCPRLLMRGGSGPEECCYV